MMKTMQTDIVVIGGGMTAVGKAEPARAWNLSCKRPVICQSVHPVSVKYKHGGVPETDHR